MALGRGNPGIPGFYPGGYQRRPAPLPQMMLARHGVFRMLELKRRDSDKYSEFTAEGKRYSTGKPLSAPVTGRLTAPPWPFPLFLLCFTPADKRRHFQIVLLNLNGSLRFHRQFLFPGHHILYALLRGAQRRGN